MDECHMKVNGPKGIKMAVQYNFSITELVIRRNNKAHYHLGLNCMENMVEVDEDEVKS